MLLKAIISSYSLADQTAELILPEHDGAVTAPIPFLRRITAEEAGDLTGRWVALGVFGTDLNDGVVLL